MQEIQKTRVRPLDRDNPLEEGMAIHSSILSWRIPWTKELGGLQSIGRKESHMTGVGTSHKNWQCMVHWLRVRALEPHCLCLIPTWLAVLDRRHIQMTLVAHFLHLLVIWPRVSSAALNLTAKRLGFQLMSPFWVCKSVPINFNM